MTPNEFGDRYYPKPVGVDRDDRIALAFLHLKAARSCRYWRSGAGPMGIEHVRDDTAAETRQLRAHVARSQNISITMTARLLAEHLGRPWPA